jgi:hypothetical protein
MAAVERRARALLQGLGVASAPRGS